MDNQESPQLGQQATAELLATFQAMAPMMTGAGKAKEDEREPKKPKTNHTVGQAQESPALPEVIRLMGRLLIRMDQDQQLLHTQASYVCFLQSEKDAILPQLMQTAAQWHQEAKDASNMQISRQPLRVVLCQSMMKTLHQRLLQLSQSQPTSPMFKTALEQGLLNPQGEFHYQAWDQKDQRLKQTDKLPISMARMIRYCA